MLADISGLKVLVFGGSSGIGAAAVDGFARHGAHVAIHFGRGRERASKIAATAQAQGVTVSTIGGDLCEVGTAARVVTEAAAALDGLDVVINNAGAMVGRARLAEAERSLYDQILDLNIWPVIEASKAALPYLQKSATPSIINVSSVAARLGGGPGAGLYASAKAFITNYTRSMARELAADGIRVNAIAPGLIDTAFHADTPSEVFESFAGNVPLGRAGKPEECTGSLLFLASAAMSGYITGHSLEINGGLLMI
jgi:3-oxoacyl-[acyl-carrier protein] reductase